MVHYGNEEHDEERVEVGDYVVRDAAQLHDSGLGGEVVGHLAVGEPWGC